MKVIRFYSSQLWTKKYLTYDSPMFWSVETKFKDQYENEPLVVVPMPSVTDDDSLSPGPSDKDSSIEFSLQLDSGTKQIIIRNFCHTKNNLKMEFIHNLNREDMEYYKGKMFLRIFEKQDKYLRVPIKNINILKNFDLKTISYKKEIFSLQIVVGGIISNNLKKTDSAVARI